MNSDMLARLDKAFPIAESFWGLYEEFLAVEFHTPSDRPDLYKLAYVPDGQTPEAWAKVVSDRMRASANENGFGRINYTGSKAFRKAAKAVGVPFNLAGLNSLRETASI